MYSKGLTKKKGLHSLTNRCIQRQKLKRRVQPGQNGVKKGRGDDGGCYEEEVS